MPNLYELVEKATVGGAEKCGKKQGCEETINSCKPGCSAM
jgi:hypothetical protein